MSQIQKSADQISIIAQVPGIFTNRNKSTARFYEKINPEEIKKNLTPRFIRVAARVLPPHEPARII
jgi:hypothetical protein